MFPLNIKTLSQASGRKASYEGVVHTKDDSLVYILVPTLLLFALSVALLAGALYHRRRKKRTAQKAEEVTF